MRAAAVKFLVAHCAHELERVLRAPNAEEHYGVPISCIQLADSELQLLQAMMAAPKDVLDLLDESLAEAQGVVCQKLHTINRQQEQQQQQEQSKKASYPPVPKDRVHARLHSLPFSLDPTHGPFNPPIGSIGARHINRLISICGTVVRTGAVKMFESHQVPRVTVVVVAIAQALTQTVYIAGQYRGMSRALMP